MYYKAITAFNIISLCVTPSVYVNKWRHSVDGVLQCPLFTEYICVSSDRHLDYSSVLLVQIRKACYAYFLVPVSKQSSR